MDSIKAETAMNIVNALSPEELQRFMTWCEKKSQPKPKPSKPKTDWEAVRIDMTEKVRVLFRNRKIRLAQNTTGNLPNDRAGIENHAVPAIRSKQNKKHQFT